MTGPSVLTTVTTQNVVTTQNDITLQHFALNVRCYKYDLDAKCCKFLKTYFALFFLSNERYLYIKDNSSSTMSFTSQTTRTELTKCLQHFELNVKCYTNVIATQNVVNC